METEFAEHRRLLAVLQEGGYATVVHEEGRLTAIEARTDDSRRPRGFAIYIRRLGTSRPTGLPRNTRAWERGLKRVLLDHVPSMDLYVALPPGRARSKGVTSFGPDGILAYLESLASHPRPRAAAAPGRDGSAILYGDFSSFGRRRETVFPEPTEEPKPIATGFAPATAPSRPIFPGESLEPCTDYLFWFEVGAAVEESIEVTPTPIPEELQPGARLAVEVFAFEGELELTGETRGEVEVTAEGGARVAVPAALPEAIDGAPAERRLFFPARTPGRPGRHRLRCNLYLGSTLVQSRLVTAAVGNAPAHAGRAIESVLDYRLSADLGLACLAGVPGHDFSLEINGNEDSHQFRFYRQGEGELFKSESSLPADRVKRGIEMGRRALRMVSWNSEEEWNRKPGAYRYKGKPSSRQLSDDLGTLALAGSNIYSELAARLTGGVPARRRLEKFSAIPGRVQIATGVDGLYVPAGLFYDHEVDRPPKGRRFELCEDFAASMKDREAPLEQTPCMLSGCRQRDEKHIVCPSGFWGFRHEIGWPASTETSMTRLEYDDAPAVLAGISTDAKLTRRAGHIRELEKLLSAGALTVTDNRDGFDRDFEARDSHLVYLYCHGGLEDEIPYVALGKPASEADRIDYDHLRRGSPWGEPPPRPVVFINGCHTTALGPEQVLDLVAGFVEEADAAGVIGTELTVFEPLACDFAETALAEFLSGAATIGAAVRRARLELLRANNPLGLVYVPFVAADTRLCKAP